MGEYNAPSAVVWRLGSHEDPPFSFLLLSIIYSEEAAEERATATSAEDLNDAVVGGKIPRTLMKLLTYCRVSDRDTCEILLELGKVKVNGEVMDNPVALVSSPLE